MMKRFLALATAFLGFAIPVLLALSPPRSAASAPPAVRGVRLLTLTLGRDVGVAEAPQSARILPAAFDVDEATGRIDVLDTVNARIVSFDGDGRATDVLPFAGGSRTVGDLVRMADGARYALDVVRRQVIRIHGRHQTTSDEPLLADEAVNARLERQGTHLYVGEALRPLLGAPPAANEPQAWPDGTSVVVGDTRVALGGRVLDVVDRSVDGRGTLWAIVDLDDGSQRLVSVGGNGAEVRPVDASVFGDVTRRLVALDGGGAVVMSATTTALTFTRYEEVAR